MSLRKKLTKNKRKQNSSVKMGTVSIKHRSRSHLFKDKRNYKGQFIKGHIVSEKVRNKIKNKLAGKCAGKLNPFYGKKHSSKTKKRIKEKIDRLYASGWVHPCLGRKLSLKQKESISNKLKGRPSPRKGEIGIYKHTKEAKEKIRLAQLGSKHWNWKGGTSFESYTTDWTDSLKESIRERDFHACQICGRKQGDTANIVHHIDYNKKNCNPKNLITLCISCHMKTNFNRDKWKLFFELKMEMNE